MAVSNAQREGNRVRQERFRARQKAKIAQLEIALATASTGHSTARAERAAAPEVVQVLDGIRRALEAQNAHLTKLSRLEHGPLVLRRLTELERLIRGSDLHISPKATRRRPLGVA